MSAFLEPNGKLKILTTTEMIHSIVAEIGRDRIDCVVLITQEVDPHSYELVKGDSEKFSHAQIVFANGLGLEHGASMQQKLKSHPSTIEVGDYVRKAYADQMIYIEGVIDPHIWLDIALWSHIIEPIQEALIAKDPEGQLYYEQNAKELHDKLAAADLKIKSLFAGIPENKRCLVTSHDAFNYFTRSYLSEDWKNHCAAPEGLSPEGQLSVSDIRRLVDYIEEHQVRVVFAESNVNKDSLKKIVDVCTRKGYSLKLAKEVLYGDAMPVGFSYIQMLEQDADRILQEWVDENSLRN